MNERDFAKLVASVREAGEIKAGRKKPSRIREIKTPDIKAIREKLCLSHIELAQLIGVSPRTLQNWEHGRRTPDGPAKALLQIASKNPKAVLEALHHA
ncbi:MAG: helix-turn-helix domain-containing protein [Candidatus Hydrogenedentes bacterium]|nr:helix-turn-helix domain-containing protein [Candidatus Hydrogenedentota bacterium]